MAGVGWRNVAECMLAGNRLTPKSPFSLMEAGVWT